MFIICKNDEGALLMFFFQERDLESDGIVMF
jgi:hypothetical protein